MSNSHHSRGRRKGILDLWRNGAARYSRCFGCWRLTWRISASEAPPTKPPRRRVHPRQPAGQRSIWSSEARTVPRRLRVVGIPKITRGFPRRRQFFCVRPCPAEFYQKAMCGDGCDIFGGLVTSCASSAPVYRLGAACTLRRRATRCGAPGLHRHGGSEISRSDPIRHLSPMRKQARRAHALSCRARTCPRRSQPEYEFCVRGSRGRHPGGDRRACGWHDVTRRAQGPH